MREKWALALIVSSWISLAAASDVVCIGAFESTQHASVLGTTRYSINCDDGRTQTTQKSFVYSNEAKRQFFNKRVVAMAKSMELRLVLNPALESRFPYAIFFAQNAATPTEISLLSRYTGKIAGTLVEQLTVIDQAGTRTQYPVGRINSIEDLSNIDQLISQENLRRTQPIRIGSEIESTQLFVLYR